MVDPVLINALLEQKDSEWLLRSFSWMDCHVGVTSRQVVWLFLEQLWLEFVPVLHRLQGRLAAQG